MNRRNMFAIWPLIVTGRNRRRKQESIKGLSGVCVCVEGGILKIPNSAWGYGKASVSGGSVNIIQTFIRVCVCVCVIYSTELQVQQCFQGKVRDFMQALGVRPTGGYTNQQSCAETIQT